MNSFSRNAVWSTLCTVLWLEYKCNCMCCFFFHCKSTKVNFLLILIPQQLKLIYIRTEVLLLLAITSPSLLSPEPVVSSESCGGRKPCQSCPPGLSFCWGNCLGHVFTTWAQGRAGNMWLRHSTPKSNKHVIYCSSKCLLFIFEVEFCSILFLPPPAPFFKQRWFFLG